MTTNSREQRSDDDRSAHYAKGSLTLIGAVSMGTGVMIGAGIFALTGQVAELAGEWFPHAFLAAALVSAFSAYSSTGTAKNEWRSHEILTFRRPQS